MSKSPKAAEKADPHVALLMTTAHAVERMTRIGDKELHAGMVAALADVEKPADSANASESE